MENTTYRGNHVKRTYQNDIIFYNFYYTVNRGHRLLQFEILGDLRVIDRRVGCEWTNVIKKCYRCYRCVTDDFEHL